MATTCHLCGEVGKLRATDSPDGVLIVCGHCAGSWPRAEPTCATCGRGGLVKRARPLTQFSRGTQLSIVGWVEVPCCPDCDAQALAKATAAGGPLPADYKPAALGATPT